MTTSLPAIPNLRLYQINIFFREQPDSDAIRKAFEKGIRSIQYMPHSWLVLSSSDAARWYARLWPLLADGDTMLICQVDPANIHCWIQKRVIDWLEEARGQIRKSRSR